MTINPKSTALHIALSSLLLSAATPSIAQTRTPPTTRDIPVAIDRGNERLSPDSINKTTPLPKQPTIQHPTATTLPSDAAANSEEDIVFTPEYLMAHPDELEKLLTELIRRNEVDGLKLLLPIYAKVENRDDSLIDWGNAIIAMEENRTSDAVNLYRKLIAALPDNKMLRFQTALALYRNNEMTAAKEQLQKLRSADISEADRKVLDQYIAGIDLRDQWSFSGSLSYIHDNNINNVAPKGTRIDLGDGRSLVSNRDQEKANGVSYDVDVDKKWSLNDNYYTSLHGSVNGVYYFNNKNYNDVTTRVAAGGGFRNSRIDVEVTPFVQKRFYARGSSGDEKLHAYATSAGLSVNSSLWLTPRWRLQNAAEFSYDDHVKLYDYLDGKRVSLNNTVLFSPNQKQYWFAGLDLSHKDARSDSDAYNRYGTRLGWGQEWGKGISTRLTGSYGKRYAKGYDFFNIKRKDDEYNANLTLWHRNIHFFGITPRLVFSYSKIHSNNRFYIYDTSKVYLDFSKTF
ncbi:MAG: porin family protein [Cardiobacteriaceae bacterium]|nr:porin family protein [Cardiobacteriaceae bacterium]